MICVILEGSHKQKRDEEATGGVEQVPQSSSSSMAVAPSSPGGSCVVLFPEERVSSQGVLLVRRL